MSKHLLRQVGSYFYGEQWQAPLARDLRVNERSVRRWVSGAEEIPRGVWRDLGALLGIFHRTLGDFIVEANRAGSLIQVHSFKVWDNRIGDMIQPPDKSTAERITRIGGEIIPGSDEWVEPSYVDAEGRMASDSAPATPQAATPSGNAKPPGWGTDELTAFIDAAHRNQYATFFRKRPATQRLVAIDAEFAKVTKNWMNPPSEILAMLFVRCHGAFRTAASLAMAGQAVETYVQCRAMLEFAAYAVHIHRDPSLAMVWLDRHQGPAELKAQKTAFAHVNVAASVNSANRHAGQRFEELYQRTIDFGGHPNERSVTGNMKMIQETERRVMLAVLQHGDGPELDMALKTTAQCGMVSLEMLQAIYDAKFELLGINAATLELRKGL